MGGAGKVVAASKAQAQAQQQAEITSTESLELASALPLVHQLVILFYSSCAELLAGALSAARQHLSHRLSPRHLSPLVLQERGSCWPGRCSLLRELMCSAPALLHRLDRALLKCSQCLLSVHPSRRLERAGLNVKLLMPSKDANAQRLVDWVEHGVRRF